MKAKIGAIVIGLILAGVGAFMFFNGNRLEKVCTDPTTAKVTDVQWTTETDDEGRIIDIYTPTIEYEYKGKTYTHTLSPVHSEDEYKVNDEVDILVNPKKPKELVLKEKGKATLPAFIFMIVGGIIVVFSIFGKVEIKNNN